MSFLVRLTVLSVTHLLGWSAGGGQGVWACETPFEGFGVHLGGMHHFNSANEQVVREVIDKLYFELQLRHYRTSYEPTFSPSEGVYNLTCANPECNNWAWESLLATISEPGYSDPLRGPPSVIASIWSPPYYMKDPTLVRLRRENEPAYLDYIRNITALIKSQFGLEIERVSPVNEPENVFAPWDHCNMDPQQLCRMVTDFQDPLVSTCTENSYYWITELYMGFKHPTLGIDCARSCDIVSTHAYALNLDPTSPNFLSAYYDLVPYDRERRLGGLLKGHRIWQTEVSSTYSDAAGSQMSEGLDLALNIVNFVGTTCVERYYFWLAFTVWTSGESLIWGRPDPSSVPSGWALTFPKKYFIYNHFTNASANARDAAGPGPVIVQRCTGDEFINVGGGVAPSTTTCLKFDDQNTVFVNRDIFPVELNPNSVDCSRGLCCTTAQLDVGCDETTTTVRVLPPQSVCRCEGGGEEPTQSTTPEGPGNNGGGTFYQPGVRVIIMQLLSILIVIIANITN